MPTTTPSQTIDDIRRMCHEGDPDTSRVAAELVAVGSKRAIIYSAIVRMLADGGPATARELHREYFLLRRDRDWPPADLLDIRRRLTELKLDFRIVTDTKLRRDGQAVMELTGGTR